MPAGDLGWHRALGRASRERTLWRGSRRSQSRGGAGGRAAGRRHSIACTAAPGARRTPRQPPPDPRITAARAPTRASALTPGVREATRWQLRADHHPAAAAPAVSWLPAWPTESVPLPWPQVAAARNWVEGPGGQRVGNAGCWRVQGGVRNVKGGDHPQGIILHRVTQIQQL